MYQFKHLKTKIHTKIDLVQNYCETTQHENTRTREHENTRTREHDIMKSHSKKTIDLIQPSPSNVIVNDPGITTYSNGDIFIGRFIGPIFGTGMIRFVDGGIYIGHVVERDNGIFPWGLGRIIRNRYEEYDFYWSEPLRVTLI